MDTSPPSSAKPRPPSDRTEHLSYEENVCHAYACAIQDCLRRRNYNEKKCRKEIARWKQCLDETRTSATRGSDSTTSARAKST